METTSKSRLHPLLTAAAISVTAFSAAGVAALTGLLPHSSGTMRDAEPVVTAVSEKPQPSIIEPSMPAAAAVATPVATPTLVARSVKHESAQPIAISEGA